MDSIVMVLMDDTDDQIIDGFMSQAAVLRSDGVNFTKQILSSPICSPSRASLMTGKLTHNHGCIANDWPRGGYGVAHDFEADLIFPAMKALGYYTAFAGKYQNHYQPSGNSSGSEGALYAADHVPAGLDDALLVDEGGYKEFDYEATYMLGGVLQTRIDTYGGNKEDEDYVTRVLQTFATGAITRAVAAGKPLFMLITPFGTHNGNASQDPEGVKFPPDPLDRELTDDRPAYWEEPPLDDDGNCGPVACPSITTQARPGDTSFNTIITNPTAWHSLSTFDSTKLNILLRNHVNRIRMAQSIDRMLEAILAQEVTSGIYATTWNILSSDNGFHLGEHCMNGGKSAPYDHDARTPLIIRPPGGTTGRDAETSDAKVPIVSNIDLYNTFLDIAGEPEDTTRDGRSLKTFVVGTAPTAANWRKTMCVEFTTDGPSFDDLAASGQSPTSRSLRGDDWLWINYYYNTANPPEPMDSGAVPTDYGELFRLTSGGPSGIDADPWQTVNQYPTLDSASRTALIDFLDDHLAAEGAASWTLQKTAIPALTFGEEDLGTDDVHQFTVVDIASDEETDLSNLVRNVQTSSPSTAPLRGDNLVVPHRAGRIPMIEKLPDQSQFSLSMWAAGGTSGPIGDDIETVRQHRSQLDTISRVMTGGGYKEFRKRFDTNWRAVLGEVTDSINFNSLDERLSRFVVNVDAPEGSWRDLNTRTENLPFDPVEDPDTGLWSADLWFTSFGGSSAPLQFYVLELYGKMFDPLWENIGPGLARPAQYMQHIGAPARLTIDTLAVTAIFDQPDDLTFTPEDEFEQVRRPYGCFPILYPRASDGAYGLRVTATAEPGRGAEVGLTGYRRYQLRG